MSQLDQDQKYVAPSENQIHYSVIIVYKISLLLQRDKVPTMKAVLNESNI